MPIAAARNTEVVVYQTLEIGKSSASISLLLNELPNSVLLQLARIDTGSGWAVSAYAVYREGPMTFEAIAKLVALRPTESLESLLSHLTRDAAFLASVMLPLKAQVDRYFARGRASA